ncbi:hypothetical protein EXS74_00450 [Candidatus Woesearchaeota archaeon]|nr:hypothetical protein [Candidatus Woesearchaeota archaeon]
MSFLLSLVLLFVYWYTGAADLWGLLQSAQGISGSGVTGFLSERWKELIISAAAFFFVTFIFGATTLVFKFVMFRELVRGEKISLRIVWKEKKGYFWPVVILRVSLFVGGILLLLLSILIGVIVYFFCLLILAQDLAQGVAVTLTIVIALCLAVLFKVAILFRYPTMFLEERKNPLNVLKESCAILRKDAQFVFTTALITIILLVIFAGIVYVLNAAMNYTLSFLVSIFFATIITISWAIFGQILKIAIDLWSSLYVFERYKEHTSKQ